MLHWVSYCLLREGDASREKREKEGEKEKKLIGMAAEKLEIMNT